MNAQRMRGGGAPEHAPISLLHKAGGNHTGDFIFSLRCGRYIQPKMPFSIDKMLQSKRFEEFISAFVKALAVST